MMAEFREEARLFAKICADNPLPESAAVYSSSGKRKDKKVMELTYPRRNAMVISFPGRHCEFFKEMTVNTGIKFQTRRIPKGLLLLALWCIAVVQ